MKIGFMDNMLKGGMAAKFAEAKRFGYEGIEIVVWSPQDPLFKEGGVDQIKGLQSEYGLEVPSLSLAGFMKLDFRHPNEDTRSKGIEFVCNAVRIISALGGDVLLIPFFSQDYPLDAEDVINQRLIEGFKACTSIAEKLGVCLAIESWLKAEDLEKLLRNIGSPAVGIYYDIANTTFKGYDAASEIRKLVKYIAQIHMKETPWGKPFGQGMVNYPAVAKAIKDISYDDYLIVEMPVEAPDDLATHLAFVKHTFKL